MKKEDKKNKPKKEDEEEVEESEEEEDIVGEDFSKDPRAFSYLQEAGRNHRWTSKIYHGKMQTFPKYIWNMPRIR